jgi:hypothetical protein
VSYSEFAESSAAIILEPFPRDLCSSLIRKQQRVFHWQLNNTIADGLTNSGNAGRSRYQKIVYVKSKTFPVAFLG